MRRTTAVVVGALALLGVLASPAGADPPPDPSTVTDCISQSAADVSALTADEGAGEDAGAGCDAP